MRAVYGLEAGDVWWAASDVGWVVGHSYIVYAPLFAGCTTILFEGKPVGTPDAGTFWRTIRRHNVKSLFTAPTAFRAIRKEDPDAALLNDVRRACRVIFVFPCHNVRRMPADWTWGQLRSSVLGWRAVRPGHCNLGSATHGSAGH